MFSEDYILRLIRQAVAVIARVLKLKDEQRYPEAHAGLNQMLEDVVGMPAGMFELLDDQGVYAALQDGEELNTGRLVIVADLLAVRADLYEAQNLPEQAQSSRLRAVTFYLEAFFQNTAEVEAVLEPMEPVEKLLPKLDSGRLSADLLLTLFSYDERTGQYRRAGDWLERLAAQPGLSAEARAEQQAFYEGLLDGSPAEVEARLAKGGLTRTEVEARLQGLI